MKTKLETIEFTYRFDVFMDGATLLVLPAEPIEHTDVKHDLWHFWHSMPTSTRNRREEIRHALGEHLAAHWFRADTCYHKHFELYDRPLQDSLRRPVTALAHGMVSKHGISLDTDIETADFLESLRDSLVYAKDGIALRIVEVTRRQHIGSDSFAVEIRWVKVDP